MIINIESVWINKLKVKYIFGEKDIEVTCNHSICHRTSCIVLKDRHIHFQRKNKYSRGAHVAHVTVEAMNDVNVEMWWWWENDKFGILNQKSNEYREINPLTAIAGKFFHFSDAFVRELTTCLQDSNYFISAWEWKRRIDIASVAIPFMVNNRQFFFGLFSVLFISFRSLSVCLNVFSLPLIAFFVVALFFVRLSLSLLPVLFLRSNEKKYATNRYRQLDKL